jgi:hypothetical protein
MTLSYDELLAKYPKLYSSLSYFECDNGWINLIDELSKKIEEINRKYPNDEDRIYAVQVKQKFGGLRFYCYFDGISKEDRNLVYSFIEEAEKTSLITCETCSKPGQCYVSPTKWLTTLCQQCTPTK